MANKKDDQDKHERKKGGLSQSDNPLTLLWLKTKGLFSGKANGNTSGYTSDHTSGESNTNIKEKDETETKEEINHENHRRVPILPGFSQEIIDLNVGDKFQDRTHLEPNHFPTRTPPTPKPTPTPKRSPNPK